MGDLPSIEKCLELLDKYGMPDNIRAHSFKVRDLSVYLARELNRKGESLNLELIEVSALLHDIAKIRCINTKEKRHDKVGAEILRGLGYGRVADIVEQHVNLWQRYEKITEEDVISYADKRVMHDRIVLLSERFKDIRERYSYELEKVILTENESYLLEKKIFKNLDFSPHDLSSLV